MAIPWGGFEFGVKLNAHEPRVHVLWELYNFGQLVFLGQSRDHKSSFSEGIKVVDVGLIAMAVTLADHASVNLECQCT